MALCRARWTAVRCHYNTTWRKARYTNHQITRSYASAPVEIVESCPSPTCDCRPTPTDLDIDREKPLDGTMVAYAEHVVVCTGRSDWPSRIEDDEEMPVIKELKGMLTRGGAYVNPFHNTLITASSLPTPQNHNLAASAPPTSNINTVTYPSILLFPSFTHIPLSSYHPPTTTPPQTQSTLSAATESLLKGFILPTTLPDRAKTLGLDPATNANSAHLVRDPQCRRSFAAHELRDVVVLVCGHGARDERCGAMGPLLEAEFRDKLSGMSAYKVRESLRGADKGLEAAKGEGSLVGQISHIGGHKFAGNVIVYVPRSAEGHPLAGKGVWYGRVETGHVEGIVKETVVGGRIIRELFRGGIDGEGGLLRL